MPTRRTVLVPSTDRDPGGAPAQIEVQIDEPDPAGAAPGTAESWLLLPSSLRDATDLDRLAEALASAGCQVLRPMPRGMGASNGRLDGLTLHDLAADVVSVIDALGGGRPAILVGHAFGHFIARVTDRDHPSRVAALVLVAAAARTFPPEVADAVDRIADPTLPRAERLAWLQKAFFADGHDPSPWLDGWHPALGPAYRAAGRTPPKTVWWPVTHAPILDLQAGQDPWRPAASRDELQAVLGDRVSIAVIEQASHALPFERPEAVAAAALAWRRSLGGH